MYYVCVCVSVSNFQPLSTWRVQNMEMDFVGAFGLEFDWMVDFSRIIDKRDHHPGHKRCFFKAGGL